MATARTTRADPSAGFSGNMEDRELAAKVQKSRRAVLRNWPWIRCSPPVSCLTWFCVGPGRHQNTWSDKRCAACDAVRKDARDGAVLVSTGRSPCRWLAIPARALHLDDAGRRADGGLPVLYADSDESLHLLLCEIGPSLLRPTEPDGDRKRRRPSEDDRCDACGKRNDCESCGAERRLELERTVAEQLDEIVELRRKLQSGE